MKQYELQQRYSLSTEMFLALCYIAQEHSFRGYIHGRTSNALRRRKLIDKEGELTTQGWTCYLELTEVGPCASAGVDGYSAKNPQVLFDRARPRLDAIAKIQERRAQTSMSVLVRSDSNVTPKQIYGLLDRDELAILQVKQMTDEQRITLLKCMLRYARESGGKIFEIASIKYSGRLVVLDDGSRWEVDADDASTSGRWCEGDRVWMIGAEMHRINESDKASVSQES